MTEDEKMLMPNQTTIQLAWSENGRISQVDGLDALPDFMLRRLAEAVFDKLPKSKIRLMILEDPHD